MKPPSNARELSPVFVELLRDQPAYKALQTEICHECRRQHVTAEGETICAHQVVRHWDGRQKKICRPCWGQAIVKAKYTGSSPWTAAEWVEKI